MSGHLYRIEIAVGINDGADFEAGTRARRAIETSLGRLDWRPTNQALRASAFVRRSEPLGDTGVLARKLALAAWRAGGRRHLDVSIRDAGGRCSRFTFGRDEWSRLAQAGLLEAAH